MNSFCDQFQLVRGLNSFLLNNQEWIGVKYEGYYAFHTKLTNIIYIVHAYTLYEAYFRLQQKIK